MTKTTTVEKQIIIPYQRKCFIHCKYSKIPVPESLRDYMPEILCHI
jgi:hypothetical protein